MTAQWCFTVGALQAFLDDVPDDYFITCSPGGGLLFQVTPTVNGMVILDAKPDDNGQSYA